MQMLNHKPVDNALEYTSGSDLERFFQVFYTALAGTEFVPLGGVHDGGADALQEHGEKAGPEAAARRADQMLDHGDADGYALRRQIEKGVKSGRVHLGVHAPRAGCWTNRSTLYRSCVRRSPLPARGTALT